MKKMVFCIIPLIMVLMGCASSGTAVAETKDSSPGIDLDAAIREAAAQMGENLPGGTQVALVSVASSSAQLSEYVISRLEAALVNGKKLVVVDRANLDRVREEQGFQMSGEVDDNSAKAIGKLLGAGAIVTGTFANLGDVYSLTLKAINIETATVAMSYPVDITKSARIETMLASGGGAAGTQTVQRGNTGGNTATAAPVSTAQAAPAPAATPASTYKIGDTGPAGGLIFYDKGNNTGDWRYLEVALEDVGTERWGSRMITGASAAEIGTGRRNTRVLAGYPEGKAAQLCQSYSHEGYNDWYLPSKDELNLMYTNLERRGIGNFNLSGFYWSSTEINDACVWIQRFSDGFQEGRAGNSTAVNYKERSYFVRPIRQF